MNKVTNIGLAMKTSGSLRCFLMCFLAVTLLASCASQQPGSNPQANAQTIKMQALEIERLNDKIVLLEKRLQEAQAQERVLHKQLSDARLEVERLTNSERALNDELERLRSAVDSAPQDDTVETLRKQLRESQSALRASQRDVARYESMLQTVQANSELEVASLKEELTLTQEELETLEDFIERNGGSVGAESDPAAYQENEQYFAQGDDDSSAQPTVVKVFYGTNRAHLETRFSAYVSPFLLPVALVLLLFAIPRAVRAVIRTYLHRVTINLFRVALVLGVLYFGFSGAHQAAQRWQAAHELALQYGPERLSGGDSGLSYKVGVVDVSIPPNHVTGKVEKADFIYFEFRSDPVKHFVLSDIDELNDAEFFDRLSRRVSESDQEDLFVFVHGFHNTFEDAAFRTAQIAHDSGFKGAPVFYSWPSQGRVLGYTTDENNVEEAKLHLTDFLEQIKGRSGAKRIHLIAHSMGSRALTSAVHAIALKNGGPVFDEMVLAAPDLDAATFKGLAPTLTQATSRLTLYASSKDSALSMSRRVHGGTYQRAGESFPAPVTVVPVDTIDVSKVTSGHSYIADSGRILTDLNDILVNGRPLDNRIARRLCVYAARELCQKPEHFYWQLIPSR